MAEDTSSQYDRSAKSQSLVEYAKLLVSPPRDPHQIELDRQREQEEKKKEQQS